MKFSTAQMHLGDALPGHPHFLPQSSSHLQLQVMRRQKPLLHAVVYADLVHEDSGSLTSLPGGCSVEGDQVGCPICEDGDIGYDGLQDKG